MVYIFSQTYSGKQTEEQNVISNNGNAENTPVAEDSSALKRAAKEAIASSGAEVNSDFSSFSFLEHYRGLMKTRIKTNHICILRITICIMWWGEIIWKS